MEGWTQIMYYVQDVNSLWDLIYFVILVMIGSIFTVNLFLVVMTTSFSLAESRIQQEKLYAAQLEDADSDIFVFFEDSSEIKTSRYVYMINEITLTIKKIYYHVFLRIFHKEKYEAYIEELEEKALRRLILERSTFTEETKCSVLGWKILQSLIEQKVKEIHLQSTTCGRIKLLIESLVKTDWFTKVVFTVIVLNAIAMAIEHHNQPHWMDIFLTWSNYIFTAFFTTEMVLKIIGLSFYGYIKDPFNLFDGIIVITSLIEIFLSGSGSVSVLRAFRLLRLIKLIRFMPVLQELLTILASVMSDIAVFLALSALVVFIFSLSGQILFGNRLCMKSDENIPCTCHDLQNPIVQCKCERVNFDTFWNAALAVFQTLTTEDWNGILVNCMTMVSKVQAVVYFVGLFFVGNFVMLNLAVAILVQSCMQIRNKNEQENEEQKMSLDAKDDPCDLKINDDSVGDRELKIDTDELEFHTAITHQSYAVLEPGEENWSLLTALDQSWREGKASGDNSLPSSAQKDINDIHVLKKLERKFNRPYFQSSQLDKDLTKKPTGGLLFNSFAQNGECYTDDDFKENDNVSSHHIQHSDVSLSISDSALPKPDVQLLTWIEEFQVSPQPLVKKGHKKYKRWNYSCFLFSTTNPVRKTCIALVNKKWFDNVILFFIFLNCIAMTFESPSIKHDSFERMLLDTVNNIFTIVFLVEMIVKQIAMGVIFGEEAYFKSGWNIMDGSLVIISVINILVEIYTQGNAPEIFALLRVLRLLRALRPLRVINRAPGLRVTVLSLAQSIKDLGNTLLICTMFFLIFGILGLQLFKGCLYHCEGPNVDSVTTRAECEADPKNVWVNSLCSFDNLYQALVTLYVVSTMDGWVDIMHTTVDAVGINMQPKEKYAEWRAIYFVSFIILMSFLLMNMVVAVLVDNYCEVNEKLKAAAIESQMRGMREPGLVKEGQKGNKADTGMSEDTKSKNITQKFILRLKSTLRKLAFLKSKNEDEVKGMFDAGEYRNYGTFSLKIREFVSHENFYIFIAFVILINLLVMATEHYDMSAEWTEFHRVTNLIFSAIFIIEAALKIYGYTLEGYLAWGWNRVDLVIVVLSVIGIVIEEFSLSSLGSNVKLFRILRMMRIARVLKLLKQAKGFVKVVNTLIRALPDVANLGILFALQLFIFSAIGVELFGQIACTPLHPCNAMSEHANFHNFGMAFLTLFICATGDNWNGFMQDTMKTDCDDSPNCVQDCCVNEFVAAAYFVLFTLTAYFILLNIVVAVLLKGFENEAGEPVEAMANLKGTTELILLRRQSVIERSREDEEEDKDG